MAANEAPDWGWWKHVPTVTLREAVALSLDLDPANIGALNFSTYREFESRLALAKRCLGESLDGPVNRVAVWIEGDKPAIRLQAFARWAVHIIGWDVPRDLLDLAASTGQSGNSRNADEGDHTPQDDLSVSFMQTGVAGRPSKGMHLIKAEFHRRRQGNECEASLREEATELETWFQATYPLAPPVKRKTIENSIRSEYRTWATKPRI